VCLAGNHRLAQGPQTDPGCEAPDVEVLLVEWLNAIIYEMAVRNVIFGRFEVAISDTRLRGPCGEKPSIRPSVHPPANRRARRIQLCALLKSLTLQIGTRIVSETKLQRMPHNRFSAFLTVGRKLVTDRRPNEVGTV
jgi:hypothetical protein